MDNHEILAVQGLNVSYGESKVLFDAHLHVKRGQIIACVGRNGAGKTTLINLISGVYLPTQGRIFFEGRDISQWHAHRVNNLGIARTFQVVRIFSKLTALENVLTGLVDRVGKSPWGLMLSALGSRNSLVQDQQAVGHADELLEFVGLRAYRDELAANLPYALAKRLEIARALATRPKLLLLDEPSSGLNPAELVGQIQLIKEINRQHATILIIEHVMKVIMDISHRLIVLDYGRKIAEGAPQEVYTNPMVIEAYLGGEARAGN